MDAKEKDKKRKSVGRAGEDIACALLREKGFEVVDRNFRSGHNEIDIICRAGDDLRFVEVKSRRKPMEGEPWEAVDGQKQRRMADAAGAYLATVGNPSFPRGESHFDVVTVVFEEDSDEHSVEYFPDAFYPMYK